IIGNRVSLGSLGYYTQADKWSKMGVTSLSQVFTSSFIPLLSGVQDDAERFARMCGKTHRLAAYLLFPAMCLLAVMATPMFHTLFGQKWDPSIVLFQLLLLRGIFMVLSSLYSNFILSLGRARLLVVCEIIRDSAAIIAILATLPFIKLSTVSNIVYGVEIFLWGQFAAAVITWLVTLIIIVRITSRSVTAYLADLAPYCAITCLGLLPCIYIPEVASLSAPVICVVQLLAFAVIYLGVNAMMKSRIQADVLGYLFGKKSRGKQM
ncbi:MAG: oligosaccharide flippase family protein, partial [Duncaniella sp.]|nr:oligosaccharide flippase family protein [Duncaniella sp.]